MKKFLVLLTAALPLVLSSCSTPPQKQAFQNVDTSALIVKSLDDQTCQVLSPTAIAREDQSRLLDQAKTFSQHQTAVVILENYTEPQLGPEFRDRSVTLFVGLRSLGYEHIVFLKGNGATDPNGLVTLADYN
ncbi:MAG: hypothetical protein P4M10_00205 [Verrucomicrobiae bacterium]|jgi:hypothetical protein|nr:hypothetical protein [Verrucomicrobiae bacterium]